MNVSAARHIHPDQLKMFMTPDEIVATVGDSVDRGHGDGDPNEDLNDLWDRKSGDLSDPYSGHEDLQEHVNAEGVKTPVILQVSPHSKVSVNSSPTSRAGILMGNGHHRVMAAENKQDLTGHQVYVPVLHDSHYMGNQATQHAYPNQGF